MLPSRLSLFIATLLFVLGCGDEPCAKDGSLGCLEEGSSPNEKVDGEEEEPKPPVPLALRLVAKNEAVLVGETVQLSAFFEMDDGSEMPLTEGVLFESSREEVATVDEQGLVEMIAGWCSSCTHYKRQLVRRAETLRNLGMLIVVIELQTKTVGQPADTAFAYAHAKALTDPPPWIVAGDLDTVLANSPDEGQGFIRRSGFVTLYPTLIVVRTRDMNLIVDGSPNGSWAGRTLPLEQIARDPEKLWLPGPF